MRLAHGIDQPIGARLRREVLARDGFRCRACGTPDGLTVHHVVFRSGGGRSIPENLTALCWWCHARVHEGLLRITGRAPHGLSISDREGRSLDTALPVAAGEDVPVLALEGGARAPRRDAGRAGLVAVAAGARTAAAHSDGGAGTGAAAVSAAGSDAKLAMAPSIEERPPTASSLVDESPDGPAASRDSARSPALCAHPPREVDAAWWAAHRHLFAWNERRGVLEFTPGFAAAVEDLEAAERPVISRNRCVRHGQEDAARGAVRGVSRPTTLDEVIGQRRTVAVLKLAVHAAKVRGEPLDHILFTGPPGLGKTRLARAVASELGARLATTSGPALSDPSVLAMLLAGQDAGQAVLVDDRPPQVVFIDELHALPRRVAEILYEAMEDGTLSLPVLQGTTARTLSLRLLPFTLIGATTDPDRLPAPLAARFGIQEELERYETEDLEAIIARAADRRGLAIEGGAADILARASFGTPRRALALLARLHDRCLAHVRHRAEAEDAERLLEELGIDADGLGPTHRKALRILERRAGPLGTSRLAALLGLPRRTFRTIFEPELLRSGRAIPTPRGLCAAAGT